MKSFLQANMHPNILGCFVSLVLFAEATDVHASEEEMLVPINQTKTNAKSSSSHDKDDVKSLSDDSNSNGGADEQVDDTTQAFAEQDEGTVIVTGTRTPMRKSESPVTTTVITRNDLESLGVNHAGEALQLRGGFQVSQSYAGSGVSLQGLDEKHTLILIDGDRLLGQKDGMSDLSRINTEQIERIEIVSGAASAIYGADAIGGVVNIITRQGPSGTRSSLKGGYGTDRAREVSGEVAKSFGRFSASLNGGLYLLPQYDLTPNDDNKTTHGSSMSDLFAQLKTVYKPFRRLRLRFTGRYESRSRNAVEETEMGRVFDREQRGDLYDGSASMKYRWRNGRRVSLSLRSSFLRDQFLLDQRGSDQRDKYEDSELQLHQLSAQMDIPLPANNLFSVGFDGMLDSIHSPRIYKEKECSQTEDSESCQNAERVRSALFVQNSYTPTTEPYLTIILGNRFEHDSSFGHVHVPRLAMRFDPSESVKLRASVGRGYRAPTFKELYLRFDNPSVGYIVRGNPELKPEVSTSYQSNIEWRLHPLVIFDVTAFRNELTDLIDYVITDGNDVTTMIDRFQLSNIAQARTQGVKSELSIGHRRVAELTLGFQWLDARDMTKNRELANRAKHQAFGSFSVGSIRYGLFSTTSFQWLGRRTFYSDADDQGGEGMTETTHVAPFTQLTTNLRWVINSDYEFFVRGENLVNEGTPIYAIQRPRRVILGLQLGNG